MGCGECWVVDDGWWVLAVQRWMAGRARGTLASSRRRAPPRPDVRVEKKGFRVEKSSRRVPSAGRARLRRAASDVDQTPVCRVGVPRLVPDTFAARRVSDKVVQGWIFVCHYQVVLGPYEGAILLLSSRLECDHTYISQQHFCRMERYIVRLLHMF